MLQANDSLTPNAVKAILQYTSVGIHDDAGVEYDPMRKGAGSLNTKGAIDLGNTGNALATADAHRRGRRPVLDVATQFSAAGALYESAGWERAGEVTITVDGRYLPNPPPPFQGAVSPKAAQSPCRTVTR